MCVCERRAAEGWFGLVSATVRDTLPMQGVTKSSTVMTDRRHRRTRTDIWRGLSAPALRGLSDWVGAVLVSALARVGAVRLQGLSARSAPAVVLCAGAALQGVPCC